MLFRFAPMRLLFFFAITAVIKANTTDGRNFKIGFLSADPAAACSRSRDSASATDNFFFERAIDAAWTKVLRRISTERLLTLNSNYHTLSLVRRINTNCSSPNINAFIRAGELLDMENVDVLITGPVVNSGDGKKRQEAELAVAYLAAMKRRLHFVLLLSSESTEKLTSAAHSSRPNDASKAARRFSSSPTTTLRMSTTVDNYLRAVEDVFVHNNWTRIGIFSFSASGGGGGGGNSATCAPAMRKLVDLLAVRRGFYITYSRFYNNATFPPIANVEKDLKTASQLTRNDESRGETRFLKAAIKNNMTTSDYMFMRLNFDHDEKLDDSASRSVVRKLSARFSSRNDFIVDRDDRAWYLGQIFIGGSDSNSMEDQITFSAIDESELQLGDNKKASDHLTSEIATLAAHFSDAVYTYALAMRKALQQTGAISIQAAAALDAVTLATFVRQQPKFRGETGFVEFDETNTRIVNLTLFDLNNKSRKLLFEAKQTFIGKQNRWLSHKPFNFRNRVDSTKFNANPLCGFYGELCGRAGKILRTGESRSYTSAAAELRSFVLISGLLLAGVILGGAFLTYYINRRRRISVLENALWRIPLSQITVMKRLKRHKSMTSMLTLSSASNLRLTTMPINTLSRSLVSLSDIATTTGAVRRGTGGSDTSAGSIDISNAANTNEASQQEKSSLTVATNETVTLADARDGALWIGRYSGQLVVLKFMPLVERHVGSGCKAKLSKMRKLQHPNLCVFYGIAYGAVGDAANKGGGNGTRTNIPFLLMEYCARGSVRDVLNHDLIKPDAKFKVSITHDIVEGLSYLHNSPLRLHGQLTTTNVVIDRRWVAKLADYGLLQHNLQSNASDSLLTPALLAAFTADKQAELFKSQVFAAPEVLRGGLKSMTQASDVYSLSMVLYELLTEVEPYAQVDLDPRDIVNRIISGEATAFRFSFTWDDVVLTGEEGTTNNTHENIKRTLVATIRQCWEEDVLLRPQLRDIRRRVRDLSTQLFGKHFNLFERVLSELEKHATQLEKIVKERTHDLENEKQKTETLLERMLPAPVARRLKAGLPVETELFQSATIFFSDIVGFTQIAARSQPIQIISLLNSLYSLMDSLLERYDAFKVETIGDAYMVVSGLPVRNEQRHVKEVSDLALEIRDKLSGFFLPPPNVANETLKMRIGVHSGACAAGVVGQAMPHYCVFGEAVSTAMLMESTSQPQKIQLSEPSYKMLTENFSGQYEFVERDEAVQTKDQSSFIRTFWLVSRKWA